MVKFVSMCLRGTSKEKKWPFNVTKMNEILFNSGLKHNQGFVSLMFISSVFK